MEKTWSMTLTITPGVEPTTRGKIGDLIRKVFNDAYGGSIFWEFGETGLGEGQLLESVEGWEWTTKGQFTLQDLLDLITHFDRYRISLEANEIKSVTVH